MFLDRVCTRIVELDRGLLRCYPGNFAAYEARKTLELAAEATAARKFDKFWRQEEAWIRKGVEARRTRDEGRVRRLEELRRERALRRDRLGKRQADARCGRAIRQARRGARERRRSASATRDIVRDLSLRIMRGDRLALLGPNGAGKSTLLKIILGQLDARYGHRAPRHEARRRVLRPVARGSSTPSERSRRRSAPARTGSRPRGGRKHVLSYLGDFLFPPQRANAPVKTLSGGERNRLLLARLFAQPANLLVLDEPTNDLDIESLELLEATLQSYAGTLLVVSHDRAFLDNIVTQTLVAEGDGGWHEYVGGYSDWLAQRRPVADEAPATLREKRERHRRARACRRACG